MSVETMVITLATPSFIPIMARMAHTPRHTLPCIAALALAAPATAQCPQNWSLVAAAGAPATGFTALAYDSRRAVTVLLSSDATTWEWNGASWTHVPTAAVPSPRRGFSLAYDSARSRVVLFGGYPAYSADTWEYDGANWMHIIAPGPAGRAFYGMAYDAARARTVMYGGYGFTNGADTWLWDGAVWTLASPSSPPGGRIHPSLAYDSARARTVLFGGESAFQPRSTWEWDGAQWHQLAPLQQPPARSQAAMAYSAQRARVQLFGGLTVPGSHLLGDTWEWDGAVWTLAATSGPRPRRAHALAYDSARARTVLFGGFIMVNFPTPETWEWSGAPNPHPPLILTQPASHITFAAGQPATLAASVVGSGSLSYQWLKGNLPLANGPAPGGGTISGATTDTLLIDPFAGPDSGTYLLSVSNSCGTVLSRPMYVFTGYPGVCYPDCDQTGYLNVEDFICYLSAFAAAGPYANCDGSTTPPVLNVNDLICFQTRFAFGCP